jgi:predicted dehydrogenase
MTEARYTAVVVGAGRMGGTIDDEVEGHPTVLLPYSHGAAYAQMPEIRLAGFADVVPQKAEALARRYGAARACADYRELIERERPDLVSICTRPGNHAEIVEFAAAHGVRGIYCEKPLCASMAEADRIVAACEAHGVKFNLGTNRRFLPTYGRLREVIASGAIGRLEALVLNCAGAALWTHTHASDLLLMLAGDPEVEFVQGTCEPVEFTGDRTETDPQIRMGFVRFADGVNGYITAASGWDLDVHGDAGKVRTVNDMAGCRMWAAEGKWRILREVPFPEYAHAAAPPRIIRDLIRAIETGGETLNGVRLARRSQEIVMGMVESHRLGGIRVALPLDDRSLYVGRW